MTASAQPRANRAIASREQLRLGNGIARAAWVLFGLVSIQALLYTPLLSWRLASGAKTPLEWLVGIAVLAVIALALVLSWRKLIPLLERLEFNVGRVPAPTWLLCVILGGLALRITWAWIFPAVPASDDATYLYLGRRLMQGEPYEVAGTRAFWPPGYPLLLSVLLRVTESQRALLLGLGLVLYVALTLVTFALAKRLAGGSVARVSALLLAIWPGLVAAAGVPGKEQVLLVLLPGAVLLYLTALGSKHPALWLVATGLLLGFGCLTQPSLLLFPTALIVIDLLLSQRPFRWTGRIAIVLLSMGVVIAPWTIRNYQVFGEFVLISTNGGKVFYYTNNAFATGAYTRQAEVDLRGLPELEANRRGFELAKQWITAHPGRFLLLAVEKQVLFLGDNAYGVYSTLRRGRLGVPLEVYAVAKGIANAFWMVIWLLVGIAVARRLRPYPDQALQATVLIPVLYFWALHSVFESSSKHSFSTLAFVAIAASLALANPIERARNRFERLD